MFLTELDKVGKGEPELKNYNSQLKCINDLDVLMSVLKETKPRLLFSVWPNHSTNAILKLQVSAAKMRALIGKKQEPEN